MSCIDVTLPPAPKPAPIVLVVAVALIDVDGRILLAQRPDGKDMAGLWEFPGGKVQNNETPEHALCRELREELNIETSPSCLYPITFASHAYETFHLLMPLYVCRQWHGTPQSLEGQKIIWVHPDQLQNYEMPPADVPLISALRERL
jgi:8-oxo-dGTP diphosphatase